MERVYPGCCLSRKLCNEVSKEGGQTQIGRSKLVSKERWKVDGILRSLTEERDEWSLLALGENRPCWLTLTG